MHRSKNEADTILPDLCWVILLAVACGFLFGKGIGDYAFWDPWEPKYSQAVREMAERGDFITPYFESEIRWTKPILIYWLILAPTAVFGNNEFSGRLPIVIAATAGVMLQYWYMARLRGRMTAVISAGILATLPQYAFMARQSMPDMVLNFFMCAAMWFLAMAKFGHERQSQRYFGLFYGAIALGVLTKGPLAIAIAVGVIGLNALMELRLERLKGLKSAFEEIRKTLIEYRVGLGIVILLVVAGPWYLLILIEHGHTFVERFVGWENVNRFKEPIRGHEGVVDYHIRTLFHGMFPWGGCLPVALLFVFQGRRMSDAETRQRWYYLTWFLTNLLIFSLAGTKQRHYLLPITPSLAVIVALLWEHYMTDDPPPWMRAAFLLSILFAGLTLRDFCFAGTGYVFDNFTPRDDIHGIDVLPTIKLVFFVWAGAILGVCLLKKSRIVVATAMTSAVLYTIYFSHYVIPEQASYKSLKYYADTIRKHGRPGDATVLYGWKTYSLWYYTNLNLTHFSRSEIDEMVDHVNQHQRAYLIVDKVYWSSAMAKLRTRTNMEWLTLSSRHHRSILATNIQSPERWFN